MATFPTAHDPRTWPMSWRLWILLNVSVYNMMASIFGTGLSPLFGLFIHQFGVNPNQASRLSTYALLSLGLANLYALPCVQLLGKRYTILTSMIIFFAANIWAAQCTSYDSLLATRFVGGLSGGMIEALGPMIISEVFYEHQLARAMAVYVSFLASGSALGPIIAGRIASDLGDWTWFFWILSAVIGANLISSILMLPETTFIPDPEQVRGSRNSDSNPASNSAINAKVEENVVTAHHEMSSGESHLEPLPATQSLKDIWVSKSFVLRLTTGQPTPNLVVVFVRPIMLLLSPQVLFPALVFGITIGWTVLTAIVVSNFYLVPPYLWTSKAIGLINFGPWTGILLGLPTGGVLADWLSNRAVKGGAKVHDPKSRLPAILPGFLISPLGCIIIGIALENKLHYMVVATGWAMLAFGFTSAANVLLTYAVDSFRARAGDVGVIVNVFKNSIGFGTAYAAMDWFYAVGPMKEFGMMAGILLAAYLTVVALYLTAGPVRRFSEMIERII